jgi:hypothetical protein
MTIRRRQGGGLVLAAVLVPAVLVLASVNADAAGWPGYGGDPQHTALSRVTSQPLGEIVWQTPVDLNPQYNGDALFIHYGSPLATPANTIVVPVKVGAADTFRVEARRGSDGALLWQLDSDYRLPAHNWVPSFSPTLTPTGRLYVPAAGGTLMSVDSVDTPGPHTPTRVAFFGIANYNSFPGTYNADVQICTPLTSDSQGNIFFGFRAGGLTPLGFTSGIARVAPDGSGTYVTASAVTSGSAPQTLMNCAPALSLNEQTVYIAFRPTNVSTGGYLVALSASTLATQNSVLLRDPGSTNPARLTNDGTASPMVGSDSRVYFGVLENPSISNANRGWLLQFDASLVSSGAPGTFGWDNTPSRVPASLVPSYAGSSPYLLMCKYNFYAGTGGDGVNKIAILDPRATQTNSFNGVTVMKEILVIAGVTPDSAILGSYPNAVREWCINTAAVDSTSKSVLAGSEDGRLYRWDLTTNTFSQSITLTPGVGEAYTPTLIAPDGKTYAINNATLFAVGAVPDAVEPGTPGSALSLLAPRPNPSRGATLLPFSIPRGGRVRLEVLDLAGRRIATILDRELAAGDHVAEWNGLDSSGRPCAPGVCFARLIAASRSVTRRIAVTR